MTLPALTALNRYTLIAPPEAFRAAATALAARVEAEGARGVLSYRFHCDGTEGRAVIDYAGPDAWIQHHEMSMGWPEMQALHGVARLAEVHLLGEVSDEMRAWLATSGLTAEVYLGWKEVAGFSR